VSTVNSHNPNPSGSRSERPSTERERFNHYSKLLRKIHNHLLPRTYVEIGVWKGKSLELADPKTMVVGIDPVLERHQPVNPEAKLFALTSDDFFANYDLRAILDGLPVDLAFIDGNHLFEFALRDFMNLERFCDKESAILVHDCDPRDQETAGRNPTPPFWSGDVWKLILCLRAYRPDLRVSVVAVPPTGLGIITSLDPASSVLADRYDEICQRFIPLAYSMLEEDRVRKLNRVSGNWEAVRTVLPARSR
jgi:hypothetical protein